MIELKNVSRQFITGKSSTTAVHDISLTINEGDFVAIIGPSGSGKSTLLNLISGLDIPDEGAILFNKRNISEYNDNELSHYRNLNIGFVFQEFHLEPFLTVKQNVLLPTYFNKITKHDEDFAEKLIAEVGLSHKLEAKINELSGGQKQRTAIARALINKPKIIVADEPTGNLDLKTGNNIIDLLKDLHSTHKTTLIIATHDEKIAKAAEKIIKIEDGHLKD